jgi:uncharacterized lipoprotein YmbA
MKMKCILLVAAGILSASCGSVELPRESWWRLSVATERQPASMRQGVLRVADLQLGNALSGDCLLVANGPARLDPRPLDRWIAPLDRLVTDALVLSLTRSENFVLVKAATDPGVEDLTIRGRIIDFAEHVGEDGSTCRAVLALWVERDGQVVFQDEFAAAVPVDSGQQGRAQGAVVALSTALQQVTGQLLGQMDRAGLLAGMHAAEPPK